MSYVLDLIRLPANVDPEAAYKERSRVKEAELANSRAADPGPLDQRKQEAKEQLARALVSDHPGLRVAQPDFAALARRHNIGISEARRRFRNIELNDEQHSIQIILFDDTAGASFSFSGTFGECQGALRVLWSYLEILRTQGGFVAFDPQVGKVLDLHSDFDHVLDTACGRKSLAAQSGCD
jgi:hypothetical protein